MGRQLVKHGETLPALSTVTATRAPNSYRGPAIAGLVMIALVFGGLGTWSALASLDSAAIAQGTVMVESNRKAVQHQEGGLIKQILVTDGDQVKKGDVLVRIDPTRVRAQLSILQGQLDTARATAARLTAERDDKPKIEFPPDLLARKSDPNVESVTYGQTVLFEARRASRRGEIEILQQRVSQLKEEIAGLQAQQRARGDQVRLINDELKGLTELFEKGFAPKTRILALQREAARLTGERGQDIAQIARSESSIGESRLRILQIQKDFQEKVAAELRETRDKIYDLEERVVAIKDQLDRTEIVAPVDGTVMGRTVFTEGGVIQPAQVMMYVVPKDDKLIIESQVNVTNIDDVAIGNEVEVHFSGLNQRKIPLLFGKVVYISADRFTDDRTGMPYYQARVEVPETELIKLQDMKLYAGMPAEVFIKTGEHSPLEYIMTPVLQSMNRAFREK